MLLQSKDLPQADRLEDVVRVAEAVQNGARTYQEIAEYIGKVGRQGRYYRLGAEILGLVMNYQNYSELTDFGRDFLASSREKRDKLLLSALVKSRFFQRVIPFLEAHPNGVTKAELEQFMSKVVEPIGPTMVGRRASSVISWLSSVGIIEEKRGRFSLISDLPKIVPIVEFHDISEPLLPKSKDLREYRIVAERTRGETQVIQMMKDEITLERANAAHRRLINLVAHRIQQAGYLPRFNNLIDLAARVKDQPYLFEMKSLNDANARSQIRIGLSQLYEYRYIQDLEDATLVLVVEKALPSKVDWMRKYLEEDRQVLLLWDGNDLFDASPKTRRELGFIW